MARGGAVQIGLEGRRAARDAVSFRAKLKLSDGLPFDVHMVDLSPLGFMARTSAPLAAEDRIELDLPAVGSTRGRVVWALGGRIGGEFAEGIPAERYHGLLAAAPAAPPPWRPF